jgi:4-carboxymuconolactone decarboxylase
MRSDEPAGAEPVPRIHHLAVIGAAIWSADWPRLRAAAAAARADGTPRADVEETLLQGVLFCGFPRVVTAFEELQAAWPSDTPPRPGALPAGEQVEAGRALFAAIYGRNAASVAAMLQSFHPDFHAFVLEVAYGRVLSRPGLAARDRELIGAGVLAVQGQMRQFVAHARGALHLGATRAELRGVLGAALGADAAAAIDGLMQRVR